MQIDLWGMENTIGLIIEDKISPVIYSNQAGGYSCLHPEVRGYFVPVEFKGCILAKFMNEQYTTGWVLNESFYDDIPEIMKQLYDYFCEHYSFELDQSKIDKNIEAWVYLIAKREVVESRYSGILQGFPETFTAILTWSNSD